MMQAAVIGWPIEHSRSPMIRYRSRNSSENERTASVARSMLTGALHPGLDQAAAGLAAVKRGLEAPIPPRRERAGRA